MGIIRQGGMYFFNGVDDNWKQRWFDPVEVFFWFFFLLSFYVMLLSFIPFRLLNDSIADFLMEIGSTSLFHVVNGSIPQITWHMIVRVL